MFEVRLNSWRAASVKMRFLTVGRADFDRKLFCKSTKIGVVACFDALAQRSLWMHGQVNYDILHRHSVAWSWAAT